MHRYFPHTPDDINAMLQRCGIKSLDDLYADIPAEFREMCPHSDTPAASEPEIRKTFNALGAKNRSLTCFAGGGYYDHFTPAVIPSLLQRSEFLTAYTPYQPEISQGTLQYIFEFQSMMASLTGMEVSNASMYDGTTATAEAMMMTVAAARKRNRVLVSATVSPDIRRVLATYAHYHGIQLDEIPEQDGVTSRSALDSMLADGNVAGVIVASPNYYGILEDFTGWADACHAAKALLVMNCIASDLAAIRTPGEWGADIAAGDAQSLGMPLHYGGPYLGYLCTSKQLIRKMPGRIVGATTDASGKRVFVLTLQAREQHIRRDKATSNICSNQGLMALHTAIYLSLLGPEGLREVADRSAAGAHYLAEQLEATGLMKLKYPSQPYFNEFVMSCSFSVDALMTRAIENEIFCGIRLSDSELLIAVTEQRTREEMDSFVNLVKQMKS